MVQKVNPAELVSDSGVDMPDQICPQCECLVVDGFCNCNYKKDVKLPELPPQVKAKVAKREEVEVVEPPKQQETVPESQNQPLSFREMLSDLPGAPSQDQIDMWKSQYSGLYLMPFDKREMYIIRPLNYREMEMLKTNERLQEQPNKFQEQIVLRGVLWPKFDPVSLNSSRAGTIPTLFEIIMRASWFVPIESAASMVTEL